MSWPVGGRQHWNHRCTRIETCSVCHPCASVCICGSNTLAFRGSCFAVHARVRRSNSASGRSNYPGAMGNGCYPCRNRSASVEPDHSPTFRQCVHATTDRKADYENVMLCPWSGTYYAEPWRQHPNRSLGDLRPRSKTLMSRGRVWPTVPSAERIRSNPDRARLGDLPRRYTAACRHRPHGSREDHRFGQNRALPPGTGE